MMEAGRELDALVAEKVMGWTKVPRSGIPGQLIIVCCEVDWWWRDPERPHELLCSNEAPHGWIPPKHSTKIAAAWEVHKVACGWPFSKRREYTAAIQRVVSDRVGEGFEIAWPEGLVFLEPVDICLAALKAKGIDTT